MVLWSHGRLSCRLSLLPVFSPFFFLSRFSCSVLRCFSCLRVVCTAFLAAVFSSTPGLVSAEKGEGADVDMVVVCAVSGVDMVDVLSFCCGYGYV